MTGPTSTPTLSEPHPRAAARRHPRRALRRRRGAAVRAPAERGARHEPPRRARGAQAPAAGRARLDQPGRRDPRARLAPPRRARAAARRRRRGRRARGARTRRARRWRCARASAPTPRAAARSGRAPSCAAQLVARAEQLAAVEDLDARNAHYEVLWDLIVDGADNIAYRLALTTLVAAPARRVRRPRDAVAAELARRRRDPRARRRDRRRRRRRRARRRPRPARALDPGLTMAEVLYYAIPFFVLLLVAEYASFRHLATTTTTTSSATTCATPARRWRWASATSSINVGWKLVVVAVYAALYELTPLRLDPGNPLDLGRAVLRRRPRLLLVPPRLAREPRLLGQPRRPPLLAALQPLDRAAPDVGADDVLPVLAAAAAARLPGLDGPARPGLVADLPVLDPHRAHQAPAARGSSACSTRRRTTASTTAPTTSTSTRTTAGS